MFLPEYGPYIEPGRRLLTRDAFREGVFERDRHLCVVCAHHHLPRKTPAVDAHHILERRLWPDGGYYLDNGASLCATCHYAAEETALTVEQVRLCAGITRPILPEHLYADTVYDKWGNVILPNGQRLRGELFYDESVQKVLRSRLPLFTPYVKYPRTYHLPWSPGMTDDDRKMPNISAFEGQHVVITEKMDGENTTMYRDHIHARSLEYAGRYDRNWVKQFHSKIAYDIPEGYRLCGENLWAQHSIIYTGLPSYFMLFSIWDRDLCLSWKDTLEWAALLGISTVPVLYEGLWEDRRIVTDPYREGYVVRVAAAFPLSVFRTHVGKYVRANHVRTQAHWTRRIVPNSLA